MTQKAQTHTQYAPDLQALSSIDWHQVERQFDDALKGADDGEIYFEVRQTESLVYDDGRLKSANYGADQGFGFRLVKGETIGFANSAELNHDAISRACEAASLAKDGKSIEIKLASSAPKRSNSHYYGDWDPIAELDFATKIALLQDINSYARDKSQNIVQVSASLVCDHRHIIIVKGAGQVYSDTRPLVRLSVSVSVEKNGRRESAGAGGGGSRVMLNATSALN